MRKKGGIANLIIVSIFLLLVILTSGCTDFNGEAKDSDNDGVPDDDDAFPNDPNEQFDNDKDNIGDNSDTDDDNDGYTDEEELAYGSDPFDKDSIPGEDDDGDGLTNDLENKIGTDPTKIDTDNDGLEDGFEFFTTGTNPKMYSTDGDRYSDYEEFYDLMDSYVEGDARKPLSPAAPELRVIVTKDKYTIWLSEVITLEKRNLKRESYEVSSTSVEQKNTQYGIEADIPVIAPEASMIRAYYSVNQTNLLINKESYTFASEYEWSEAKTTDLSESYIRIPFEIKNVGTDILRSDIHISFNLYIGNSSILATENIDITQPNLQPKQTVPTDVTFTGFLTLDLLKELDRGKAIRVEPYCTFGDDQIFLFNVQKRSIELEIDNGDGLIINYIHTDGNTTLTNFLKENANMVLDNGNISSIFNLSNNPPDGWWEILLPTKTKNAIPQNPLATILKPGDHIVLVYYRDTDHDNITNRQELILGLDPYNPDTDFDGINDYRELFGDIRTNPLLNDTDGDTINDREEIDNGTDPNNKDTDSDGYLDNDDYFPTKNATIGVYIHKLRIIDDIELAGNGDIYFIINVSDTYGWGWSEEKRSPSEDYYKDHYTVEEDKNFSIPLNESKYLFDIPDNTSDYTINIQMWDKDHDPFEDWGKDERLDINGHDNARDLTLYYDIVTGQWVGDDNDGITDGSDDGTVDDDDNDAYLEYDIKTEL